MRFGLALPHYDFSLAGGEPISFESTARFAHMAERLEFDSAWVSDHFFLSLARYGGPPDLQGSLEARSEEHTSELQSRPHLVCRLLLEKKKKTKNYIKQTYKKKKKRTYKHKIKKL